MADDNDIERDDDDYEDGCCLVCGEYEHLCVCTADGSCPDCGGIEDDCTCDFETFPDDPADWDAEDDAIARGVNPGDGSVIANDGP